MQEHGAENVFQRIRRLSMYPLVNAGAIATTSLVSGGNATDKWNRILAFYSNAAGEKLSLIDEVY